jgi:hypothetical protein
MYLLYPDPGTSARPFRTTRDAEGIIGVTLRQFHRYPLALSKVTVDRLCFQLPGQTPTHRGHKCFRAEGLNLGFPTPEEFPFLVVFGAMAFVA